MKTPGVLEDFLTDIIDSCAQTDDYSLLFDSLGRENYLENLDLIYSKIDTDISKYLPSNDARVMNLLHMLKALVEAFGISENVCFKLAKTVLLVIIDENSSIVCLKRAINALNSLLQNRNNLNVILYDESLEGTLQIFGRKIPEIGDYECQALLFESLYRISSNENREYWANIWFPDAKAKNMFLNIVADKFELNCRETLNYINRIEENRKVFSYVAKSVLFGSFQLKEPYDNKFWIDFNYDSQSISFYCLEFKFDTEDSLLWETICIYNSSVESYYVKNKSSKYEIELILLLNCPCHELIPSSNMPDPSVFGYEVKILFFGSVDNIENHLEKIYGKDKCTDETHLAKTRKISEFLDVIEIYEFSNGQTNENFLKRKISNSHSILVGIDETEEQHLPKKCRSQLSKRIYNSVEVIKLTSENEACQNSNALQKLTQNANKKNDRCKRRKISSSFLKLENFKEQLAIKSRKKTKRKGIRCPRKNTKENSPARSVSENANNDVLPHEESTEAKTNINDKSNLKLNKATNIDRKVLVLSEIQNNQSESKDSQTNKVDISNGHVDCIEDSFIINKNDIKKCSQESKAKHYNDGTEKEQSSSNEKTDYFADVSAIESPQSQKYKCIEKICSQESCKSISSNSKLQPQKLKTSEDVNSTLQNSSEIFTGGISENLKRKCFSSSLSLKIEDGEFQEIASPFKRKCSANSINLKMIDESNNNVMEPRKSTAKRILRRSREKKLMQTSPVSLVSDANGEILMAKEKKRKIEQNQNYDGKSNKDSSFSAAFLNKTDSKMNADVVNNMHNNNFLNTKKSECEIVSEEACTQEITSNDVPAEITVVEDTIGDKCESIKKNLRQEKNKFSRKINQDTIKSKEVTKKENGSCNLSKYKKLDSCAEANNSGMSKSQLKKVRLYNPDTAPVYDVPPVSSSSQHTVENAMSQKNNHATDNSCMITSSSTVHNAGGKGKSDSDSERNRVSSRNGRSEDIGEVNAVNGIDLNNLSVICNGTTNSDDDFEKVIPRGLEKNKRNESTSPLCQKGSTKKRNTVASCTSQIEGRSYPKAPRQAAIRARQVNKRILDCDEVKELKESDNGHTPVSKKKRVYNIDTDTSTSGKSSIPLFESPKKTNFDSGKRKNKSSHGQTSSNEKSKRKPYQKKRVNHNKKAKSQSIAKRISFSDLEDFNLTVEKSNRKSYPILEALENDLHKIASNSRKSSSSKENSVTYSKQNILNLNQNVRSENFVKNTELWEDSCEPNIDYSDGVCAQNNIRRLYSGNETNSALSDNIKNPTELKKTTQNKCILIDHASNSNSEVKKNPHAGTPDIHYLSEDDDSSLQKIENEPEENVQSENECIYDEVNYKNFNLFIDQDEKKGKQSHLERFLECAVRCSGSTLKTKSKSVETEYNVHSSTSDLSKIDTKCGNSSLKQESNSVVSENQSALSKAFEYSQVEIKTPGKSQCIVSEDFKKAKEQLNSNEVNMKSGHPNIKNKQYNSLETDGHYPDPLSIKRGISECTPDEVKESDSYKPVVRKKRRKDSPEKHNNFSFKDLKVTLDPLSLKNYSCSSDEKVSKCVVENIAKKMRKPVKTLKQNKINISKNLIQDSISSCHSKLKDIEHEKIWFNEITSTLSHEADALAQKLLGTVQRCFSEYSDKMCLLREKIIETAENLEESSTQNLNPHKLRDLIKSCSIVRNEVEKSLKYLHIIGRGYFQAEKEYYRKLIHKHVKANKKYSVCMQKAEENAIHKMKEAVLLKTKYFLKKFLKDISSS